MSSIHQMKKHPHPHNIEIKLYKYLFKKVKQKIQVLFTVSINDYLTEKVKNIKINDNNKLFSKINPIFRPNKQISQI